MSVLVDASVIVSALVAAERDHAACHRYLARLLNSDERVVLAAHTLVEAYAALTKPRTPAVPPQLARRQLRRIEARVGAVMALSAEAHRAVVDDAARQGLISGAIYDAAIAAVAAQADVEVIATLNVGHFRQVWPGERAVDPRTV